MVAHRPACNTANRVVARAGSATEAVPVTCPRVREGPREVALRHADQRQPTDGSRDWVLDSERLLLRAARPHTDGLCAPCLHRV